LAGAGDHTPYSTHVGKRGYPTQGEIHAIDVGMTDELLRDAETFLRRGWRKGMFWDVKYFNVLGRHWNNQTASAWKAAQAGTTKPRASGDHHLHLSMENGTGGGDILALFVRWLANGRRFDDEIPKPAPTPVAVEEGDDMAPTVFGPLRVPTVVGERVEYTIPPVNGGTAGWGRAWLGLGVDGGEVLLRCAYQLDGERDVWRPLFGDDWGNREHVLRLVRAGDARDIHSYHLPAGTGKVSLEAVETQVTGEVGQFNGHAYVEYAPRGV
jgi:hypothetical protein